MNIVYFYNVICVIYWIHRKLQTIFIILKFVFQDYFVFVNGLEGTLVLRKALDYETLSNFTIGIRAQVIFLF